MHQQVTRCLKIINAYNHDCLYNVKNIHIVTDTEGYMGCNFLRGVYVHVCIYVSMYACEQVSSNVPEYTYVKICDQVWQNWFYWYIFVIQEILIECTVHLLWYNTVMLDILQK